MVELVTKWTKRKKKAKERYDICLQCEHIQLHNSVCKLCGCFLKAKTMFPEQACPIDKWKEYKEETNG